VHSAESTKNAATNAMLLTVSFYVIFTTLPATLVYVLANVYPEVRPAFHGGQCDVNTTTTSAATPTSVTGAAELATDEVCLSLSAFNARTERPNYTNLN